jgi:hypothetical protein
MELYYCYYYYWEGGDVFRDLGTSWLAEQQLGFQEWTYSTELVTWRNWFQATAESHEALNLGEQDRQYMAYVTLSVGQTGLVNN